MKKITCYLVLPLLTLLVACGGAEIDYTPDNLRTLEVDKLRDLLKTQRAELKETEAKMAALEEVIEEKDPAPEVATLVVTEPLTTRDFQTFVDVQGSVTSDEIVAATAEVAGRITRLTVDEGDNVRRGQLIATLDLESLDKQIAEIETSLSLARETYNRYQRLWDQNIGSEIQLLQSKNQVERLEKSLETIRFQQGKQNVYAPISGSVEMVFTKQGEIAAPGAPIVQILDTRKVKVVVDIPETYINAVRRGQMVKVTLPALNRELDAKVTNLGRTIDPNNRTFEMEIALSNNDGTLKPNLLAEVRFVDETFENAVVVPEQLVQQEVSGRSFVYVAETGTEGTVARKKYVEIGSSYNGNILIEDGLTGNETLITQGARTLSEGQLITSEAVTQN